MLSKIYEKYVIFLKSPETRLTHTHYAKILLAVWFPMTAEFLQSRETLIALDQEYLTNHWGDAVVPSNPDSMR